MIEKLLIPLIAILDSITTPAKLFFSLNSVFFVNTLIGYCWKVKASSKVKVFVWVELINKIGINDLL